MHKEIVDQSKRRKAFGRFSGFVMVPRLKQSCDFMVVLGDLMIVAWW